MTLRNDCFALPPGVDWVPVDDALARLRDGLNTVVGQEVIRLEDAGGRILAKPVLARRSHPPCANSAIDGYGFCYGTIGPPPWRLPLVDGRSAAGTPYRGSVPAGAAVRILTGAQLPDGVDTVVMQEDVTVDENKIRFDGRLKKGTNARAAGEDILVGETILDAGHRLTPQDIGMGTSAGVSEVVVFRRLRVGVLSTGDEIVPPSGNAPPHQTFDANRPMLLDMLRSWDMEPVDLGCAPDDAATIISVLDRARQSTDAILTSGGASAGDEDHISRLLREKGELSTWRIAIKPGRPLALGLWRGVPVFGLPGNPVAAFVCSAVFARPALFHMAGAPWLSPEGITLPASFAKNKKAGRREFLRARLNPKGKVEVFPSEGSGRISGLSWANGLVELSDEAQVVSPGTPVRFLPFSAFGI